MKCKKCNKEAERPIRPFGYPIDIVFCSQQCWYDYEAGTTLVEMMMMIDKKLPTQLDLEKILDFYRPEIIICAAIKLPDDYIIRGHRHDDCFRTLTNLPLDNEHKRDAMPKRAAIIQGFVTSRNRFVNRYDAMDIFSKANPDREFHSRELYSEDLY